MELFSNCTSYTTIACTEYVLCGHEIRAEVLSIVVLGSVVMTETLYHRDDALLYIAYVMLIWAAPIPADRWHCSLWP